jgi:hypothetical protein
MLDLRYLTPSRSSLYSPKTLMSLCLGLLKLSEIDDTLKTYLLRKTKQVSRNPAKPVQAP